MAQNEWSFEIVPGAESDEGRRRFLNRADSLAAWLLAEWRKHRSEGSANHAARQSA